MSAQTQLLAQIEARLAELQNDVNKLSTQVEALQNDFIKRGVVYKIVGWLMGVLSALAVASAAIHFTTPPAP